MKTVPKKAPKKAPMKDWPDTRAILHDMQQAVADFKAKDITLDAGKFFIAAYRGAGLLVALDLAHARFTKRLKVGQSYLEGIKLQK